MNVLEFHYEHTLTYASSIDRLLKAWSVKIKSWQCQSAGPNALFLTFPASDASMKTTVKIQDMTAVFEYDWVNELTAFGTPELSRRFAIEVKGKDEQGVTIILKVSASYYSRDGKSWSKPYARRLSFTKVKFS
jgi:hypothetical protein